MCTGVVLQTLFFLTGNMTGKKNDVQACLQSLHGFLTGIFTRNGNNGNLCLTMSTQRFFRGEVGVVFLFCCRATRKLLECFIDRLMENFFIR